MMSNCNVVVVYLLLVPFLFAGATDWLKVGSKKDLDFLQLPLIPHHENIKRRRNMMKADIVELDVLYQGYGTHYIDLWVGTPPQRQTLIVGTDFHLSGFPCSTCNNCGKHKENVFDELSSASFTQVPCNMCEAGTRCKSGTTSRYCDLHMSYADGSSWYAYEARDVAHVGLRNQTLLFDSSKDESVKSTSLSFKFLFGCQTKVTGLFATRLADGVLGMNKNFATLWSQMYRQRALKDKSFSLCFARQAINDGERVKAGAMTLGGYDERLHFTPILYSKATSATGDSDNFHLQIRAIYLRDGAGGEYAKAVNTNSKIIPLNISESSLSSHLFTIVSRSSETYLPASFGIPFKKAFYKLTGKDYTHSSIMMTESQVRALPTIILQIVGDVEGNKEMYHNPSTLPETAAVSINAEHPYDVLLAIPPSHYMERVESSMVFIAGLYFDDDKEPIIGANSMMGHDIHFDVKENRIGWAESGCDYHAHKHAFDTKEDQDSTNMRKAINSDANKGCSEWYCYHTIINAVFGSIFTVIIIGVFGNRFLRDNRFFYKPVVKSEYEMQDFTP
mmetsp:Transcript_13847/g.20429  ORF Transcript_13847/g.20429 Transcript_13847/m.20429 type:complete len:561 (+) Transcript_13847:104-1786(+)